MKLLNAFIGGFTGAVSVTLIHEILRHLGKGTPRLDKLGMEATKRGIEKMGYASPTGNKLYVASISGDLITNTICYAAIAARPDRLLKNGMLIGLLAGVGAISLPASMGLDPDDNAGSTKRKAMTIGFYTLGGITTACVIKRLEKR